MAWLSPAYPIGAFSYSERASNGRSRPATLPTPMSSERWLAVMIAEGGGFCDAVFFVHAHRAVADGDDAALRAVAELAAAFAPSKERHLETTAQGRAFLETTRAAWPCAALDRLRGLGRARRATGRGRRRLRGASAPLAPALACLPARAGRQPHFRRRAALPLGQTDGQRVLAALEPVVVATAERALATPLDEVGGAAFRADLASMRHETQYTRLFRS